jgi:hypothetical protein
VYLIGICGTDASFLYPEVLMGNRSCAYCAQGLCPPDLATVDELCCEGAAAVFTDID